MHLHFNFDACENALTFRVRALNASKSQRACIILSKFTRKSKATQLINSINIHVVKHIQLWLSEDSNCISYSNIFTTPCNPQSIL